MRQSPNERGDDHAGSEAALAACGLYGRLRSPQAHLWFTTGTAAIMVVVTHTTARCTSHGALAVALR
jgi:hypothetical protein